MSPAKLMKEFKELLATPGVLRVELVGSAVYREDAKDVDVLVLADSKLFATPTFWVPGGSMEELQGDTFCTFRTGEFNYLLTYSESWFDGCYEASELCAALKLPTKYDRCLVHRVVRDGLSVQEARLALAGEGVA